jgi:hypothetical protein
MVGGEELTGGERPALVADGGGEGARGAELAACAGEQEGGEEES